MDDPINDYKTNSEIIGGLVKNINQAIQNERNRYLGEFKLTASQTDVLLFVLRYSDKEINQVDIEKELHLKNPTVSGILNRLELKGFIEKKPSNKDKRYKRICPTQKAIELHRLGINNKHMIEINLLKGFSEEETKKVIGDLKRLLYNVRHIHNDEYPQD